MQPWVPAGNPGCSQAPTPIHLRCDSETTDALELASSLCLNARVLYVYLSDRVRTEVRASI